MEISLIACSPDGDVFVASRDGEIGAVVDGNVSVIARATPEGLAGRVSLSALCWSPGRLLAADAAGNRVLAISKAGGASRFGPRVNRPIGLTIAGGRLIVLSMGSTGPELGLFEGESYAQIDIVGVPEVVAIAGSPGGSLVAATRTALYEIPPTGRASLLSGSPREGGYADGSEPRFAHNSAIAYWPDHGWTVTDASSLRLVSEDGIVTTIADRAVHGADRLTAVAASQHLAHVVDPANQRILAVSIGGEADVLVVSSRPATPADDSLHRFAEAIVAGDESSAVRLAEELVRAHEARGDSEPDRRFMPVSVASARVGRALALSWSASLSKELAYLGGFCLWLIRAGEGESAPVEDAGRLARILETALQDRRIDRIEAALSALDLTWRLAVWGRSLLADAVAETEAAALASNLLLSSDSRTRAAAVRVLRMAAEPRFIPALAIVAFDNDGLRGAALEAIDAGWSRGASRSDELVQGLRFSEGVLRRLVASFTDQLQPETLEGIGRLVDRAQK